MRIRSRELLRPQKLLATVYTDRNQVSLLPDTRNCNNAVIKKKEK